MHDLMDDFDCAPGTRERAAAIYARLFPDRAIGDPVDLPTDLTLVRLTETAPPEWFTALIREDNGRNRQPPS